MGSSSFVQSRWRLHKSHLIKNIHSNKHLQNSFNRCGKESFQFILIEECSIDILIEREQYWIDFLNTTDRQKGYNNRLYAENNIGIKRSEETRKKISEAKKGKCFLSDEHYKKLADINRGKPNQGAINYQASLSKEQKTQNAYRALEGRKNKAKERGSHHTPEGHLSYKKKRGKMVYQYDESFNLINTFLTISDALKFLGMSPKNTSCITNQIDKDKLYKGYYWKSIEHSK